jgi:hypothetical protein
VKEYGHKLDRGVLTISTVAFLTLAVLFFARPNGQAIKSTLGPVWSNPVGRHIVAIVILVIALQIVKAYARYAA